MSSVSFNIRIEEQQREKLDQVAEALGRNRNWCVNEAIDQYLELHAWQLQHIRQGKRSTTTYSTEQVRDHFKEREAHFLLRTKAVK